MSQFNCCNSRGDDGHLATLAVASHSACITAPVAPERKAETVVVQVLLEAHYGQAVLYMMPIQTGRKRERKAALQLTCDVAHRYLCVQKTVPADATRYRSRQRTTALATMGRAGLASTMPSASGIPESRLAHDSGLL